MVQGIPKGGTTIMKRVVIVGAGFGGLRAASALAGKGVDVLLIDRHNYHLFHPLLYQVATASLEQESIAYPVRAMTRHWKGVNFRLAEVCGVDLDQHKLKIAGGTIEYDYLILAAGSVANYFGMETVERYSYDLKKLRHAVELRNQILGSFEKASTEPDPERRKALLTFIIVGGGPTGVEFAGALQELIRHVLSKDYPELASTPKRTILIEASDRLLTPYPADLRDYTVEKLKQIGVEIMFKTQVSGADPERVLLGDGTFIPAHTLFWCAGVSASPLAREFCTARAAGGRIPVEPDLTLPGRPEVFIVGDLVYLLQDGSPLPMMAPVAMQEGEYVGKAILNRINGKPVEPFRFRDKGIMATIGRSAAVAYVRGKKFSGHFAWLVWLALHLMYLAGFRNRLVVLINWAYYYFFHERQVRLITREDEGGECE
jgi:NADH:ubiquinone reductase (H+-translocating)